MRTTPLRKSRAFTLIELLVVIAIIGILVAMLLPAVQSAREAGRRTVCINNMKQWILAVHLYEQSNKFLPPGAITTTATDSPAVRKKLSLPSGVEHGWAVFVLPFIEQQALYDRYDFSSDFNSSANQFVREQQLNVSHCPSNPGTNLVDTIGSGATATKYACSDYGVDNGMDQSGLNGLGLIMPETFAKPQGVMLKDDLCMLQDIPDGMSHTMWIAEDAGRPFLYRAKKRVSGGPSGGGWAHRDNWYITHGYTTSGTSNPGPCAVNCTNDNEIYSFHPTGANICMGDGSIRFLRESVEMRIVCALITRAGGETVDDNY